MSLVGKDSFCSSGLKRQIQLQEVKKNDKKKKKNAKTTGASLAFCSVHMNPQKTYHKTSAPSKDSDQPAH